MISASFIQTLLRQEEHSFDRTGSFREGQVLNGKVTKLFANQMAEVQVGNQRMIAQLEIPLVSGERYWFQVQPGEGKVHLKVLAPDGSTLMKESNTSLAVLLKQFNLPHTKENLGVLSFFLKEELPITKDSIQAASRLLAGTKDFQEGLQAIKQILLRQLPMTKDVFSAMKAALKNDSFSSLISELTTFLNETPKTISGQQVLSAFNNTVEGTDVHWEDGGEVLKHLKSLVKTIGLSYEQDLNLAFRDSDPLALQKLETLKSLLIRFVNEKPSKRVADVSEQLLNKITGLQLLSQEVGPIQQFVVQLPLTFLHKSTDLTVQWSGRKKDNGQIDPDYCRVLFYLDLEYLQEVLVDMQIQNRILRVTVMNDTENIQALAAPFIDSLRKNLDQLNYYLSSISFHHSNEQKDHEGKTALQILSHANPYNGVDIKI